MIRAANLPMLGRADFSMYGQKYTLAKLDTDEIAIFEDNFNKLLATTDSQVRKILEERVDTIIGGIMAIKEKMNGRKFRGVNPADMEIGMGFIRPGFTKSGNVAKVTTGAPINTALDAINFDWELPLTGMGTWDGFLGSSATAGYVLPEDFGLIVTHLVSQITPTPFVRTVHFEIGRMDLIPEDVSNMILGDNENGVAVYPVPTKIVIPEDEFLLRAEGRAGSDYLQLGGLVIGLGRIIKIEDLRTPAAW